MSRKLHETLEALHHLMDEVRGTCLWYVRDDYYPQSQTEALRVLEAIQRHGDLAIFQRAGELRTWLSRTSNAQSAAS